jgi:hypothetical protein
LQTVSRRIWKAGYVPIDYKIDHEQRLVHATAHGVVVLQDILDYFDAVALHDAAAYQKLFDAREMVPQLDDDDFMVVAARVSAYSAFDPRGAVAAVATSFEALSALRRYANFFGGDDRPVRLFERIETARAWLAQTAGR